MIVTTGGRETGPPAPLTRVFTGVGATGFAWVAAVVAAAAVVTTFTANPKLLPRRVVTSGLSFWFRDARTPSDMSLRWISAAGTPKRSANSLRETTAGISTALPPAAGVLAAAGAASGSVAAAGGLAAPLESGLSGALAGFATPSSAGFASATAGLAAAVGAG